LLPELAARGISVSVLTFGDGPTAGYGYPLTRVSLAQNLIVRRQAYLTHYRRLNAAADLTYINNLGLPRPRHEAHRRVIKVVGDFAWERAVNRGWVPPMTDIDKFQKVRYSPLVEGLKWARAREVQTVDHVIVPSAYLRNMVIGWGAPAANVSVILNAFKPAGDTATLPSQAAARQLLGLAADARVILTAARLTAWKGVDFLIDAVARLPDLTLVIAGDGPQGPVLRAQAEQHGLHGRVIFLGKIGRDQMLLYMRAADYFALYSGYEGLAHVLVEAFAVGTPVIASRRGGNPEVVTHGLNGMLVDHPDLDSLVAALQEAFVPGRRERFASNLARSPRDPQSPLAKFNWDSMVSQTLEQLQRSVRRG
jgi:glycosyltransferase involved in cell wall biosynthesis